METIHYGKKVNILSKKVKWGFDIVSEKHGVTGVQARVLNFIVREGNNNQVFQKKIEEEFRLRRSTVTGIVQLMEERELITREISKEDARAKKIKLTKKGIELQKIINLEIEEYESLLVKGIDRDKLKIFSEVISDIYKNIDSVYGEGDLC
ncbi:MarR family winged helix-turn-helix transcriptional regulator [Miniphocaeibacter massiliensis]|uniref:MarR family winged helix-turn-helix transcriptional regulator n=1 Tax=Miniphocaeibacter massiliensis TaxID=2041841 RepID=UPI000C1BDFA6|nr:MarR family transcriptional regulator [Miniphocaeibacter massiliensis]